ncbi:MAG TPA: hypothetical protein DD435_05005 [Cyanobacteria bacterium UBA8530]|nr:hypothetical protein [Cyanobacteria bacterium UBA8530]
MEVVLLKKFFAMLLSGLAVILTLSSMAIALDPAAEFIGAVTGSRAKFYIPLVKAKAAKYGIPPLIVAKMIYFESHFDPHCRSPYGYIGLMQLNPGHARRGEDLRDPADNIEAGCRLLAAYHRRMGGDWHRALSAYSHGPNMVASRGLYRTRYSRRILGNK